MRILKAGGWAEAVKRVLLTGMSGVGKSTVGAALRSRGFKAVDLDDGYCTGDSVWNETLVDELLSTEDTETLFVIGAAENQPRFYSRFDLVILVSAPVEVMLARLEARTTNPYGKTTEERAKVLADLRDYEPLIRRRAHHELGTNRPVDAVIAELLEIVNR